MEPLVIIPQLSGMLAILATRDTEYHSKFLLRVPERVMLTLPGTKLVVRPPAVPADSKVTVAIVVVDILKCSVSVDNEVVVGPVGTLRPKEAVHMSAISKLTERVAIACIIRYEDLAPIVAVVEPLLDNNSIVGSMMVGPLSWCSVGISMQ